MAQPNRYRLIVVTDCDIIKLASAEKGIEILDIRPVNEHCVKHLMRLPTRLVRSTELAAIPVRDFSIVKIGREYVLAEIWKEPCTVCKLLIRECVYLIHAQVRERNILSYTFSCGKDTYAKIREYLEGLKLNYILVKVSDEDLKPLTPIQEYVIELAYRLGYFNYPRKITLKGLSKALNMSQSSVNEVLRRGLKRLVEWYMRSKELSRKFSG